MICGRMVQIWAVYSLSRNMPMLKGLHLFKVCLISISYFRNVESNDGPSTLSKVIHVLFSLLPFSLIFTQIGVPIIRSCNFLPTNYAPMFFHSEIFFQGHLHREDYSTRVIWKWRRGKDSLESPPSAVAAVRDITFVKAWWATVTWPSYSTEHQSHLKDANLAIPCNVAPGTLCNIWGLLEFFIH